MVSNLRNLRMEKGISQRQLADDLNLLQQSICKYENKDTEPNITTLVAMAEFFDTSIDYLVGYTHVRGRVEKAIYADLDGSEIKHIENLRLLSPEVKAQVNSLINSLIKQQI